LQQASPIARRTLMSVACCNYPMLGYQRVGALMRLAKIISRRRPARGRQEG
jgi:hypothetical protein